MIFVIDAIIIAMFTIGWSSTLDSIAVTIAILLGSPIALILALFVHRKNPLAAMALTSFVIFAVALINWGFAGGNPIVLVGLVPLIGPFVWLALTDEPRDFGPSACANCGYSLAGLHCNNCPECGNAIATASEKSDSKAD